MVLSNVFIDMKKKIITIFTKIGNLEYLRRKIVCDETKDMEDV
jgi:hypothetical protein